MRKCWFFTRMFITSSNATPKKVMRRINISNYPPYENSGSEIVRGSAEIRAFSRFCSHLWGELWKAMWRGGGTSTTTWPTEMVHLSKFCRISHKNAWESFENCVVMTNNGKFLGKYIFYIGRGTRDWTLCIFQPKSWICVSLPGQMLSHRRKCRFFETAPKHEFNMTCLVQ